MALITNFSGGSPYFRGTVSASASGFDSAGKAPVPMSACFLEMSSVPAASAAAEGPNCGDLARGCSRRRPSVVHCAALVLFIGVGLAFSAHAAAPPAPVPRTGQTACYAATGSAVTGCPGTGQDGDTATGVAWPDPRFAENGDLTILDKLTGLVWTQDANPAGGAKTWQEALDYIKTLNGGNHLGQSDWRLPNVNELESLVNKQPNLADWLHAQGFRNLQVDYYWTSTTYASLVTCAWSVGLYGGIVAGHDKAGAYYVWPVRQGKAGAVSLPQTGQTTCYDRSGVAVDCAGTGQDGESQAGVPWPNPRFVENADGTVADRLTGLAWSKEGMVPGPDACLPGKRRSLQGASRLVTCLNAKNYLGRKDWRLPNRNELASLVNHGQADSAAWLNSQGFSRIQSSSYWSSSTFVYAASNGWSVNLHDGAVTTCAKPHDISVWPVRGGE